METRPTQRSTQSPLDERDPNRLELETSSPTTAVLALVGEHDVAQHAMRRERMDRAASRRRHLVVAPTARPVAAVVELTPLAELIRIYPSLERAREALETGDE
jgi:hypothetical protein